VLGSRWLCLVCGGLVACIGDGGPLDAGPQGVNVAASAVGTRWLLAYPGGPSVMGYTIPQFQRLLAQVDSLGQPQMWLFEGAIFLSVNALSGHVFTTWTGGVPADGDDWSDYLDSLFDPGAALSRLDSTVAILSSTLGAPADVFRVSIMIPYPDPGVGTLTFHGQTYDFTTPMGRSNAAGAYVRAAMDRFQAAGFQQLKLDGFYWLLETVPAADTVVVPAVASVVHALGLRLLWIPYFNAERWAQWSTLGFDAAWLQPNFFFDPSIPDTRLDSAAALAQRSGMGMEVEFDSRVVLDSQYSSRLAPYLSTLTARPALSDREITVYEGAGGLVRMSWSRLPATEALYHELGDVLR